MILGSLARCAAAAAGRRSLATATVAAGNRKASTVASVKDFAKLLAKETGRTRVGNTHLKVAVDVATADDLESLKGSISLFVLRNKPVKRDTADSIVRRYASEGHAAVAAGMVTDKVEFGLFPSAQAYVDLMRALAEAGHGQETIEVFERLVLEHGPMEPPPEILDMVAAAAAQDGVGAKWAERAAAYCIAAASDGASVDDSTLQSAARGVVASVKKSPAELVAALAKTSGGAETDAWKDLQVQALATQLQRAAESGRADDTLAVVKAMEAITAEWARAVPREALAALADLVAAADGDESGGADDQEADGDGDGDAAPAPALASPELAELAGVVEGLRAAGVSWEAATEPTEGE